MRCGKQKEENMDAIWEIFWAFCDVYYSPETPVADFEPLIAELIVLTQQSRCWHIRQAAILTMQTLR
jgi:hypothetical protein